MEYCVKTKVGLKKNRTIPPINFCEGEIENKLLNGFGTYTHRNGSNYFGQYKDGLREGQGPWTLYDGSKFVGIWKDGRRWKGKSFDEEGRKSENM